MPERGDLIERAIGGQKIQEGVLADYAKFLTLYELEGKLYYPDGTPYEGGKEDV